MTREKLGVRVGEALLGTCGGLIDTLESLEISEALMDDRDFCAGLDATAMLCQTCEWWCAPDELDDDCNCGDCSS